MRAIQALAVSTLALLSAASVAAAQDDRYDPPRPNVVGDGVVRDSVGGEGRVAPAVYKGPFLTWAGKASPAPSSPPPPPPAVAPPVVAPAAFASSPPHQPPMAQVASPAAPPPVEPPLSAQAMMAPPAAPPAPAQATSTAAPAAQASATTQGARFYSLHRDYGLTPDPDPAPTGNPLVLVGPPTGPQGGGAGASDGGASDDSDSARAGQQGAASDSGGE